MHSGEFDLTPIAWSHTDRKIGEGSHADIFEIHASTRTLIVKIGKTHEYCPPFFRRLNLTFDRARASVFLEFCLGPKFRIVPDERVIRTGAAEYALLAQYFGGAAESKRRATLEALNDSADCLRGQIAGLLTDQQMEDLRSEVKLRIDESFLPVEQVVIGHAPPWSGGRLAPRPVSPRTSLTYYIIQEAVTGPGIKPLADVSDEELLSAPYVAASLMVFAVLAKKMYLDQDRLIDARPDQVALWPFEWFRRTSNILVDFHHQRIQFVDTRWLWSADSRVGRRGINLVEMLGIRSLDRAIRKLACILSEARCRGVYPGPRQESAP